MRSDHSHCASSPRAGAGGGLCKAFKDMKSKVATHTGISLSFVELVATSPAVGLLPALLPSPRSPSALLHRHMHLGHSVYSFVARKPSSSDESTCADTQNLGTQSMCAANAENSGTQSPCAVDAEVSGAHSTYDIELETVQSSSEYTHPSSSSSCHACEDPSSSSSTCNLSCSFPSSSTSTCNFSCRHPSLSSVSCNSSSSLACNLPCAHPSLSCGLSCGHLSSLGDLPYGHQLASSPSSVCDSLSEHSACSHSYAPLEELVSDMHTAPTNKLSSKNADCCNTFCASSPVVCKRATTIFRVTSQIPSTTARVLYFFVMLIFAMSNISKGIFKSCMWVSRRVIYPHTGWHNIGAGSVKTKSGKLASAEDDGCSNEKEGLKVDVSVGQQSSHLSKASCMKRSKLLKSKLRSSFKSLSVQVPRKAFAPLHFNAFPHSSSSSSLSTPASPLSSNSHAVNNSSPTARKTRMLKGHAFASKLTRSFNHRQPWAVSPSSPGSQSRNLSTSEMVFSKTSSCEAKEHSSNGVATSTNMSGASAVAPIIAILVALCALFYGKGVAFIAVMAWLLAISVANCVCSLWRKPRNGSLRLH